jgi:hypothetical protein
MHPSLFDPNLKLQWAKKRLDEFTGEALRIQELNPPNISTEDDLENGWYVIRIQIVHDITVLQAALMAGDFIANLRSCLDHLAWQLSAIGGIPGNGICFPICERDNSDARKYIAKSTVGMPSDAVAIIKSLQPYHAGNDYRSTHLWRLNKLWNIEKHRHLTPHSILTDWQFKTTGVEKIGTQQIDDCTIIRVPLADKSKVEFNPSLGARLTIYDRDEGFELTVDELTEMYDFVSLEILPSFSRFFPDSIWIRQKP